MKTYSDYLTEWENSTENGDMSSEELFLLILDRQKEKLIKKAGNWLKENVNNYICVGNTDFGCCEIFIVEDELFEDFKKSMEDEEHN